MAIPIYLILTPGARRDATAEALGPAAMPLDGLQALGALEAREPGVIIVDPREGDAGEIAQLALRIADAADGWTLALLTQGAEPELRALSVAPPTSLSDAAAFADDPSSARGALLELRRVLSEISRTRHDVNNPLTSALAETQLLLLDADEGEIGESLQVIQEQLRRIRDLVADVKHLRLPRD